MTMRMKRLAPPASFVTLLLLLACSGRLAYGQAQNEPVAVEASDLDRRADLVGKVVSVDDRVRFYQFHPGEGYDELRLKRTDVVFRLPPQLRPESSPRPMPVIVQGKLIRDGGQLACEVTALKVLPNDLERLDQAIAALPASDFANRKAWAAWAEHRGKSFKPEDKPLIQRARSIQADALRIESEQKRVGVDAPGEWLRLAEEGRRKHVEEPYPSALAHKAFHARLNAASKTDDVKEVLSAVERFFPQASADKDAGRVDLGRWEQAYATDPAGTYRSVPATSPQGSRSPTLGRRAPATAGEGGRRGSPVGHRTLATGRVRTAGTAQARDRPAGTGPGRGAAGPGHRSGWPRSSRSARPTGRSSTTPKLRMISAASG